MVRANRASKALSAKLEDYWLGIRLKETEILAAPIAVPTPVQFPALIQLLNILFIFIDSETTNGLLDHEENPLRGSTSNVKR